MLVLTRRVGEKVVIGEEVMLTVVSIKDGRVRLGVTAPRSIAVQREELKTGQYEAGDAADSSK